MLTSYLSHKTLNSPYIKEQNIKFKYRLMKVKSSAYSNCPKKLVYTPDIKEKIGINNNKSKIFFKK